MPWVPKVRIRLAAGLRGFSALGCDITVKDTK